MFHRKFQIKRFDLDNNMIKQQMLTVREVAQFLNCSEPSVRNWLRDKKLKKVKIMGRVYIPRKAVEALIYQAE